uniref:hypothetical protein n=1 Tax=uncultured Allobacillus sp. TaxID=1638025 RepID=UPI00259A77D2|nr:hypothetical protein [uncultured Allobacillus sp.]
MEEERKVRVAITKSDDYDDHQKKHDLEHFLTPKQKKKPPLQNMKLSKWLKPILFAIVLGLVFGAGLMYFFSDYTADDPAESGGQHVSNVTNDDESDDAEGNSNFTMGGQQFQLIQYGIFSSTDNAKEHMASIQQTYGVPVFYVEKEGQYYVVGSYITSSEQESQSIDWLENKGLVRLEDFLVKDWQLAAVEAQVSDGEQSWLEKGEALIGSFSKEDFRQWVQEMPDRFKTSPYADQLSQLTNGSSDDFMTEKTMQLCLSFFLAELP